MRYLWVIAVVLSIAANAGAYSPVARTDVVPYQRIDYGTSFNFGVVAFSKPGIDRVEFAISGQGYSGGTKTSSTMTLNTRVASAEYDGVWEYWVTISASEFTSNGAITVTPTAYDNNANSRTLDAVTLYVEGASADYDQCEAWVDIDGSDGTGTIDDDADPFPSIQSAVTACQNDVGTSSGNIIYLVEDTYSISGLSGSTSGEWLTIKKAASADRDNVIINEGTPNVNRLKVDGITLQSQGGTQYVLSNGAPQIAWTNGCRKIGSGQWTSGSNPVAINAQVPGDGYVYYSTNDYTYNVDYAYRCLQLARGAVISTVGNDAFENFLFVVNATVDGISNGSTNAHADVLQSYHNNASTWPVENRIAFNVYATDIHYQGIMRTSAYQTAQDNAYVNVFVELRDNADDDGSTVSFTSFNNGAGNDDHILVWHCSFPYAYNSLSFASATNTSIVGNLFWQANGTVGVSGDFDYNHFMYAYGVTGDCTPSSADVYLGKDCPRPQSDVIGTNATSGDGVVDISTPGASNFGYPVEGSDLVNALPSVYVPVDALNNVRDSSPDIGALEWIDSINITAGGSGTIGGGGSGTIRAQ